MSVYTFNDNFQINAPKHIDTRYLNLFTPYANTAAANAAIPGAYRYLGLTVLIGTTEYWYQAGVADGDLVPKLAGGASVIITANNGLTVSPTATNVQLGGTLIQDTSINGATFTTDITSATTSGFGTLSIENTSGTAGALNVGVTTGSGVAITGGADAGAAIFGFAHSGPGAQFISVSGTGVSGQSTTGVGGIFITNPASTNSIASAAQIWRTTSGTAAAGIGGALDFVLSLSDSFAHTASQITTKWLDATLANYGSQIDILTSTQGFPPDLAASFTSDFAVFFGTSIGIQATSGLIGAEFIGTNTGAIISSASLPVDISNNDHTNGTIKLGINISSSSTTATAGNGTSIAFSNIDTIPALRPSGRIINIITDPTNATYQSSFQFETYNTNSPAVIFTIKGNGVNIGSVQNFVNNAAAITGGLVVGDVYRNGDVLQIVH